MDDRVFCDYCSANYSNSSASGGLLFGSYATCPTCAPKIEADAKKFGEERYIKARCPENKPFAQ